MRETLVLVVVMALSFGCGSKSESDRDPSESNSTAVRVSETNIIDIGDKTETSGSVAQGVSKRAQVALEISSVTNVLDEFNIKLKAHEILQKMWDIPYETRLTNDILKPSFVSHLTNTVKNASTILELARPMSGGLAKKSDMKALIDMLIYAESIAVDPLEKSDVLNVIGFLYDRLQDYNKQLYYREKQLKYAKTTKNKRAIIKVYNGLTLNLANLERRKEALKLCDEISDVYPDYSAYFKCQAQPFGPQEIDKTITMYEQLLEREDICKDVRGMAGGDLRMLKVNRVEYRAR